MKHLGELSDSDIGLVISPSMERIREEIVATRLAILSPRAIANGMIFSNQTFEPLDRDLKELLLTAVSDIDTQDKARNGSVARYPGVFAVSDDVINACTALNHAKADLENSVRQLMRSGATEYMIRKGFRAAGHPRLHQLQACRRIAFIEGKPASISFTVAKKSEGIAKMSREQVTAKLREYRAYDIAEQIMGFSEDTEFSWCTPVSPHVRANVVWGEGIDARRKMLHASMPFLLREDSWPSKRVRFNKPRNHALRSDMRREIIIYLPFREGAYLKLA